MELNITNNSEKNRFQATVGDQLAVVEYMDRGKMIVFTHTEVPVGHEGQGIGSKLAKHVLDYARAEKKTVMPLCPYIAAYIRRHKEYQDLVMPGYKY